MPSHAVIFDENYFTFYLTGGIGNTDPNQSLGGVFSRNRLCTSSVPAVLFDDVTYGERTSGSTEYRGLCMRNEIATGPEDYSFYNVKLWVTGTKSNGEIISITTASSGLQTNFDDALWTMSTIPDETTAPSDSVTWYTTSQTLSVGTIPTWSAIGFWIKRYVPPGVAAAQSSMVTISVYVDAISGALIA